MRWSKQSRKVKKCSARLKSLPIIGAGDDCGEVVGRNPDQSHLVTPCVHVKTVMKAWDWPPEILLVQWKIEGFITISIGHWLWSSVKIAVNDHRSWSLLITIDHGCWLWTAVMITVDNHRSWSLTMTSGHDHRLWPFGHTGSWGGPLQGQGMDGGGRTT